MKKSLNQLFNKIEKPTKKPKSMKLVFPILVGAIAFAAGAGKAKNDIRKEGGVIPSDTNPEGNIVKDVIDEGKKNTVELIDQATGKNTAEKPKTPGIPLLVETTSKCNLNGFHNL